MRKLCRATADTGRFSGAVLVADKGEVLYKEAFGLANHEWDIPNTTDTRFRLASVSKQFCSMIVMQLVQEGKVNLDDKITDHLTYYRADTGNQITIHHLLCHQLLLEKAAHRARFVNVSHEHPWFSHEYPTAMTA